MMKRVPHHQFDELASMMADRPFFRYFLPFFLMTGIILTIIAINDIFLLEGEMNFFFLVSFGSVFFTYVLMIIYNIDWCILLLPCQAPVQQIADGVTVAILGLLILALVIGLLMALVNLLDPDFLIFIIEAEIKSIEKKTFGEAISLEMFGFLINLSVVAPIYEEIIFRYFILCRLLSYMSKWKSILLTAIVFSSFHFLSPYILILSIISSIIFIKTGSLFGSIVYHMTNNILVAVLILFISYDSTEGFIISYDDFGAPPLLGIVNYTNEIIFGSISIIVAFSIFCFFTGYRPFKESVR